MISFGQKLLSDYMVALTGTQPVLDARPAWLDMEIDIWFEKFDLAIEFQGQQHYSPIYGSKNFKRQRAGDKLKRERCEAHGVLLVRIQICQLKHPTICDVILARFIQTYGKEAGAARFFAIAGENPISRLELHKFASKMRDYRLGQIMNYGAKSAVSNSQERRLLKRAMLRRTA